MTLQEALSERVAWLVIGGIHLADSTRPSSPDDVVVLAPVVPIESDVPSNTIVLGWKDIGQTQLQATSIDGSRGGHSGPMHFDELFTDMLPGATLRSLIATSGGDPLGAYVPISYLSGWRSEQGLRLHAYAQVRFLQENCCFIRVTDEPLVARSIDDLSWLPVVVDKHREHALFLHNHQCYYRRLFPGQELEYKYPLSKSVDIWTLTVEIYGKLRAGALPGYVMEYRDEFQAWDYLNHLFEVPMPASERGYVSFLPTTDGRYTIKRKRFSEDAYLRGETHTKGVRVDDERFPEYVEREMGLTARQLPTFRRVRYDVNFESVRTGNVYGIFFDHSSIVSSPDLVLRQCELEYLRSRAVNPSTEDVVRSELDDIAGWLEGFLTEHGESGTRYTYSKLSFLRDAVASRPDLERGASL